MRGWSSLNGHLRFSGLRWQRIINISYASYDSNGLPQLTCCRFSTISQCLVRSAGIWYQQRMPAIE
jgi:hypothetical protein